MSQTTDEILKLKSYKNRKKQPIHEECIKYALILCENLRGEDAQELNLKMGAIPERRGVYLEIEDKESNIKIRINIEKGNNA